MSSFWPLIDFQVIQHLTKWIKYFNDKFMKIEIRRNDDWPSSQIIRNKWTWHYFLSESREKNYSNISQYLQSNKNYEEKKMTKEFNKINKNIGKNKLMRNIPSGNLRLKVILWRFIKLRQDLIFFFHVSSFHDSSTGLLQLSNFFFGFVDFLH